MGRELKRVALNFNWPLDKVWEGYINPHYKHNIKCEACDGSGNSPQSKKLHDLWYGNAPFTPEMNGSESFRPETPQVIFRAQRNVKGSPGFYGAGEEVVKSEAQRLCDLYNKAWCHHLNQGDVEALVKADRLWDFTRTARTTKQKELVAKRMATGKHNSWLPRSNGYHPKAREVNLWSINGFGHDSLNAYVCIEARCKAYKWPTTCAVCKGQGAMWNSPENKKLAARWRKQEPPKGKGFQIWETVSEGSPISPVFATPEELADWLVTSDQHKWRSNDRGTTRDQWLKFINGPGWAPTMMSNGSKLMTGVQAVTELTK